MRSEEAGAGTVHGRMGVDAVRERERELTTPHPRLASLFRALDREGVRWCVLRGEAELDVPVGDVDLLVARTDLLRLQRVAWQLGFARVPAWGYGSHAFFVAYDVADDLWLKVDVVTELTFGPHYSLATEAEEECLARRRRVGETWLLAADDAFWTLLLHRLIDKGGVDSRDAARLPVLADGAGTEGTLARHMDSLCPAEWSAARLVAAARERDWTSLAALSPALTTAWRSRRGRDARRRAVVNRAERWSGKLLRLSRRRGLGVALLAPDGAGKSTLAQGIERSFYFPVRSIPMGLYPVRRPRSAGRVRGIGMAGQLAAQWNGWLRGAYERRRGRLVLFDRYGYDALLPTRFRYNRLGRARRWLLARACPPPDLVILLDAPGDVLHARKGEKTVDLLEQQRQAYRALLSRLPRAHVVDASREADEVRREVVSLIWAEYLGREAGRKKAPSQSTTRT